MRINKRIAGILAAMVATGVVATAPAASATPIPYPIGGDVSVAFNDFQFPSASGCFNHVGSLVLAATDDLAYLDASVNINLTITTKGGQYVDGWSDSIVYSGTYTMTALICSTLDGPGAYNVSGTVTFRNYSYGVLAIVPVSDTFNVTAFGTPPPAPPVVAPPVVAPPAVAPPAVVVPMVAPVMGNLDVYKVSKRQVNVSTYTDSQPANTTAGAPILWKIKADNRIKTAYTQGFNASKTTKVKFPAHSGTHKVRVYKNGILTKTTTVRTGR